MSDHSSEPQHHEQPAAKRLHFIEQKIDDTKKTVEETKKNVEESKKQIEQIWTYVIGDEYDKTRLGALERISKLEARMLKAEARMDKWFYIIIGASFTSGLGIQPLLKLLGILH